MAEQNVNKTETAGNRQPVAVKRSDLPLHCPTDKTLLWNSHPRVYLPIETTGKARCPYCGTDYQLVD